MNSVIGKAFEPLEFVNQDQMIEDFEKKLLSDFKKNPGRTRKLEYYLRYLDEFLYEKRLEPFLEHELFTLKPWEYSTRDRRDEDYLIIKLEESPKEVIHLAYVFDDILEDRHVCNLVRCFLNTPLEKIKEIWNCYFKDYPKKFLELLRIPSRVKDDLQDSLLLFGVFCSYYGLSSEDSEKAKHSQALLEFLWECFMNDEDCKDDFIALIEKNEPDHFENDPKFENIFISNSRWRIFPRGNF